MVDVDIHRANDLWRGPMLITWLNENSTTKWSESLRFVQFLKNRSHHRVIDQTPYNALFGSDPKIGLASSYMKLTVDILNEYVNEHSLVALIQIHYRKLRKLISSQK